MRPKTRLAALLFTVGFCTLASPFVVSADPPDPAIEEANSALVRAARAGRVMLTLLDETRRSGDTQQSRCVDRALTQINSFTQNLERRRDRLQSALARGDHAYAAHEQRVIRIVEAQVRDRQLAGRACVFGRLPARSGQTVVQMTVDRAVPQHDDLSVR